MTEARKPNQIGPRILAQQPVWEFINEDDHPLGETAMQPVKKLPTKKFDGCIFGTNVVFADGTRIPASISDLNFGGPSYRHHFRSLTIFAHGKRFHLAKYFQIWFEKEGPDALARFLKKKTDDVFPITYDISHLVIGPKDVIRGQFFAKEENPIPGDKIMRLIVEATSRNYGLK